MNEKRTYMVERSYLVRYVETYAFETEYDLEEWMENDWAGADAAVVKDGRLLTSTEHNVDDDELDLVIVTAEQV